MTGKRTNPILCPVTGEDCYDGSCRVGTELRPRVCVAEKLETREREAFNKWRADLGGRRLPPDKPVPPRPWKAGPEDLGL